MVPLCGGHRYQRAGVRISEMHTMACAGDIEGHHNVGHGNNQILFYFLKTASSPGEESKWLHN